MPWLAVRHPTVKVLRIGSGAKRERRFRATREIRIISARGGNKMSRLQAFPGTHVLVQGAPLSQQNQETCTDLSAAPAGAHGATMSVKRKPTALRGSGQHSHLWLGASLVE